MPLTAEDLRIYRCYQRLPPEPGGMERHIESLTAAQRALGVQVVHVHNTGEAIAPAVRVLPNRDLRAVKPAVLRDVMFYVAARSTVRPAHDAKVNVLHVHGDYSAFLASRLLARRVKARLVVASFHGAVARSPVLYRASLGQSRLAFATGFKEAAVLSAATGRHVHHLPSAPLDVFFSVPPGVTTFDVIAVGNLLPVKRTDLLVACAAQRPNLRFALYGDGPERPALEALIAQSGATNVTLFGSAPPKAVATAMAAARVFVNLSTGEGTPTAALEAMACRLPVVMTPSNNYGWLVRDGENGFVTSGWDVAEILSRIDTSLADENKRSAMGEANRTLAETHRWSAKASLVTQLMLKTLETCNDG
jgi:glycosyltransferase involved in cell wall biosynthesis